MVNVTTSDILTEEAVMRVMDEEQMERLVWDSAFETLPMDADANDTVQIPEDDGLMGEPDRVAEGAEFPREEEDYSKTPITVEKHGFEISISDEANMFAVFDAVARQTEKAVRRMNEYLNGLAFDEVNANLHTNSPISGGGTFDFSLVTEGRKELFDSQHEPSLLILNTEAERQLLNSDAYRTANELGADVTQDAAIVDGRFAGMDVVVDNSGNLGDSSTATGIIIDPSEYGYEVVADEVSTNTYRDDARQAEIHQLWTIRAYKAIDPNAAIKIEE